MFFSFFYETWTNKKENNNNNRNDRARDGWLIPFNEYRKQNTQAKKNLAAAAAFVVSLGAPVF